LKRGGNRSIVLAGVNHVNGGAHMKRTIAISLIVVAATMVLAATAFGGAARGAAALGLQQGGVAPLGSVPPSPLGIPAGPVTSGPGVRPDTSGWHCNADTCINVWGTGLHVSELGANGFTETSTGAAAPFWYDYDGKLAAMGITIPWAQPGLVWDYWLVNLNLPNGDTVCLVWVGSTGAPLGNPCIGIHS
jgi:hypothetical protein